MTRLWLFLADLIVPPSALTFGVLLPHRPASSRPRAVGFGRVRLLGIRAGT